MVSRLVAPGLVIAALVASLGGADGLSRLVLLAAIVAGGVRLLDAVGSAAEGRSDRFAAALSTSGLVLLVAAAALHAPLLALGLVACTGLELIGAQSAVAELPAESAELVEVPMSRAA